MKNNNFAIVIPTKNRPKNLKNLIQSLCESLLKPVIVIIVDSSDNFGKLNSSYLNIIYENPNIIGQVKQRNYGIKKLIDNYDVDYILCLDDDILLFKSTLTELFNGVDKFRKIDSSFIGFSLNIVNNKSAKSFSRRILMYSKIPGKITKSAYNSSLSSDDCDIESDWVLGGATLWSKEFLKSNINDYPFSGKAYGEDLYYSSKIRSIARFAVIESARCLHNDIYESEKNFLFNNNSFVEGYRDSQARFFIANSFPQYSLIMSILHTLWIGSLGFIGGIFKFNGNIMLLSLGRIFGCIKIIFINIFK
jgi:glycosyltransferase involved in cell wall biosynthesis